jgi:hypothetical protein
MFPFYAIFLLPSNLGVYHHGLPVTNLILGLLVDLFGLCVLVFGFLVAIQRLPEPVQRMVQAAYAGTMLWLLVNFTIQVLGDWLDPSWWYLMRERSGIALILLLVALSIFLPRIASPAVRVVRLVIAAIAFSILWIVPQLLHLALVHRPDETKVSITSIPSDSRQRIVWILFDELSYDQTFDHPFPGMQLPNFDRLRAQSVSFSNLSPVGYATDFVIPGLFLGRRIDQIRSTADGDLWYQTESQKRWIAYDPNATLFALAEQNGWSSGISGWYIPYCQILGQVLDACSWEPAISPAKIPGTSEDKSVLANAAVLPVVLVKELMGRTAAQANAHAQEYQDVMAHNSTLLQNGQIRFIFLHIPVPHPPSIYDRRHHMLHSGGTYLDNLALADEAMGTLLQEIDATPSASQTTVIVSSDHSWRIAMWKPTGNWSPEEERASGGHFDPRPVFLIHFPGQTSGEDVNTALPELLEHDIIADMLLGKVNNPDDLNEFLSKHGR